MQCRSGFVVGTETVSPVVLDVKPVRLPSYSMATDMMVGTTGTVSGWGKTHDSE